MYSILQWDIVYFQKVFLFRIMKNGIHRNLFFSYITFLLYIMNMKAINFSPS